MKIVCVRMRGSQIERLKRIAEREEKTFSEVLRDIVDTYLAWEGTIVFDTAD